MTNYLKFLLLMLLTCPVCTAFCQEKAGPQLEPLLYLLSDDSIKFQDKNIGIDFLENELIHYRLDLPENRRDDLKIKLFVLPKVSLNTVTQVKLVLKTNSFLRVVYKIPPNEKMKKK